MTTTITDHAALLRDMAEEAYWVLRQLRESAPAGHTVTPDIAAPLALVSRFAAEVAQLVEAGTTHQPVDSLPDPAPLPVTFPFTCDQLARHNARIFADGMAAGAQLPTVRI